VVQRQSHWRPGEEPQQSVERAVAAQKRWGELIQLPPSNSFVDAYESNLSLVNSDEQIEKGGSLFLRAHLESDGTIIIALWQGQKMIRRAHIGQGHREPDNGPFVPGPHIHFPTSVFQTIEGRKARTRVYNWNVSLSVSLFDAMMSFAPEINLVGVPVVQQRRLPGGK